MSWQEFFDQSLQEAEQTASRRQRWSHVDDSPVCLRRNDGTRLINFATNDYLGLRHDPRLIRAAQFALKLAGCGAGASPLVSGYNLSLAALEQRMAQWQDTEACLVFSSGLAMNIGVISALISSDDLVLSDRLNHASLIDGCRLSAAHRHIYAHGDLDEVRQALRQKRSRYRRVLLITESIFSMDGDQAPLRELAEICAQYDTGLMVDEAHATGIYGPTGAGLGEALGETNRWLGKLGTLSKAMGTCGGYVAGSRGLVDFLVNRCRTYMFSTAIAPPTVAAAMAAACRIPQLCDQRVHLRQLSRQLRERLQALGWQVSPGDSPIVPIIVGDNREALELSSRLLSAGLLVPAIRPPTVPTGTARLRVSLCALHTSDHIDLLIEQFKRG